MTKISHRITGATIFEADVPTVKEAAELAVKQGVSLAGANLADANLAGANLADANLAGAYLAGANLARANLADAYLAGANLAGAYLADANLAGANLAGAYLADANLADAYLADAYLAGANLADANLAGANLAGANLARANLAGANLAGAYLAGANLARANLAGAYLAGANLARAYGVAGQTDPPEPYVRDTSRNYAARAERARKRHPEVPVVENLDAKILQAIENGSGQLDMSRWHTCETVHCMAGWAIVLAGDKGKELEAAHGSHRAGMLIFSCSTGQVPHFFAKNDVALADLKARVAEAQASEQTTP